MIWFWSHIAALLKPNLDAQQTHLEASLWNKSLCLAPALGVTKFTKVTDMILITLFALLKSDLDVQQAHLEDGLLNIKLMLSSSFECDQIYKCQWYYFDYTLLCYLSPI